MKKFAIFSTLQYRILYENSSNLKKTQQVRVIPNNLWLLAPVETQAKYSVWDPWKPVFLFLSVHITKTHKNTQYIKWFLEAGT